MRTVSELEPREFENFTYDLLVNGGLRSLVWRTPGSDGGRDIEGYHDALDWTGEYVTTKWYIECKRYASSISWPIVWTKLAHAEAHGADFLLLSTNSNPSPACENEIASWNSSSKRTTIRVWRGYQFPQLLQSAPQIGVKYGLLSAASIYPAAEPLITMLTKVSHANASALEFGADIDAGTLFSAALSELLMVRFEQLKIDSRISQGARVVDPPNWPWLEWAGSNVPDDVGVRALLAFVRYVTRPSLIKFHGESSSALVLVNGPKFPINVNIKRPLKLIASWTAFEISIDVEKQSIYLTYRSN